MSTEKWAALTDRSTVATTQLNSLANGSASAVGSEIDNGTNLDRYGIAVLAVTFGTNPTADSVCDLYCVPAPDGTNYMDASADATPPANFYVGSFQVNAVTTAQKLATGLFQLPPCKMKFVVVNRTGQAFPASGSTVNLYTTNRTIA